MMYPATTATCNLCRPLARLCDHGERDKGRQRGGNVFSVCPRICTGILHIRISQFSDEKGVRDRDAKPNPGLLALYTDRVIAFNGTTAEIFLPRRFDS